jgi:hypothetical protein
MKAHVVREIYYAITAAYGRLYLWQTLQDVTCCLHVAGRVVSFHLLVIIHVSITSSKRTHLA